ncbi:hypothetical protein BDZ91DRAFT_729824 [Kalaharituber pfeilii]|nr:hypothetical protein BDZ91DRAFT_729824 [Kalaharituber pfeilii]
MSSIPPLYPALIFILPLRDCFSPRFQPTAIPVVTRSCLSEKSMTYHQPTTYHPSHHHNHSKSSAEEGRWGV